MDNKIDANIKVSKPFKNYLKNSLTIKRAPTSNYNNQIFNRANSSKIDLEKAHYEAELLLDEEDDFGLLKNQAMFERKNVSIIKFYCHLFEPIDYLYLFLGTVGLFACGLSNPILNYLNAHVYSKVGNTSEHRDNLTAQEIMKLNVKDTMNSNIKKQLIYGAISLVGNLLGYYFIGLLGTRCLYNFKKNYFNVILSQEQGWFDSTNVFEFATKIQAQLEYIELGLGEGFGRILIDTFIGIGSFIFAFFGSWKLTLVVLCLTPLVVLFGIIMNKQNVKGNTLVRETWEIAGGIGEEIFYNIKTVASFANFDYELKRFYEKVEISNKIELLVNFKIRLYYAILVFLGNLVIFIAFIYGRTLVKKILID